MIYRSVTTRQLGNFGLLKSHEDKEEPDEIGWGIPLNRGAKEPIHFYRADGSTICNSNTLHYVGPKIDSNNLPVAFVCLNCLIAYDDVLKILGRLECKVVDVQ